MRFYKGSHYRYFTLGLFLGSSFLCHAASASTSSQSSTGTVLSANASQKNVAKTASAKASNVATSSAPTLEISGFTCIYTDLLAQGDRSNGTSNPDAHVGLGASNLYFTIKGGGFGSYVDEYGYRVVFDAYPAPKKYVSQNYVFFEGKFGTFHAGNVSGVEDRMVFNGNTMIQGANGLDGSFPNLFNNPEGLNLAICPNIETGKALKISYYTPAFYGFKFGISFTPNTQAMGMYGGRAGNAANDQNQTGNGNVDMYPNKKTRPYGVNNLAAAINYAFNKGDFGLKLMALYMMDTSKCFDPKDTQKAIKVNDGRALQLGGSLRYKAFEWGVGYFTSYNSRLFKSVADGGPTPASPTVPNDAWAIGARAPATKSNPNWKNDLAAQEGPDAWKGNAGQNYNTAVSYTKGAWIFVLAYNRFERKVNATEKVGANVFTATVDFQAAPGLTFFVEGDYFNGSSPQSYVNVRQNYYNEEENKKRAIGRNHAVAGIAGVKVRF